MRALVLALGLVAVACGERETSPRPHGFEPPPALPPTTTPLAAPACAPFEARAAAIAATEGACTTDADCACRSGLFFDDCGTPTTTDVARQLSDVLRDAAAAGCSPDGIRCAPYLCEVACRDGRCDVASR
jgi:hypothetical protein